MAESWNKRATRAALPPGPPPSGSVLEGRGIAITFQVKPGSAEEPPKPPPLEVKGRMENVPFGRALHEARCGFCGEELEWEANFDADGTTYKAKCCRREFRMESERVRIEMWDAEDADR